jgi:hypothetical protein
MEESLTKLTVVYLSGQAMFFELGKALRFNGKYGWHILVKGGYVEVELLK